MWKIDNNQNHIIDPHGRIYTPAEIIKLAETGKIIPVSNNNPYQTSHGYAQKEAHTQNWLEALVTMLNANPSVSNVQSPSPTTQSDLTRLFMKKINDSTAQLVEFFSDGTVISSNNFTLPRGKDGVPGAPGTPGASDSYQPYMTYEVNAKSFVFSDYNPSYDYCFYFYFSLVGHDIVGRLEVPMGLDPNFLVSNVALDYATTSSVMMLFDAKSKTLMSKNWSEVGHVISKIDVYRKPGINY